MMTLGSRGTKALSIAALCQRSLFAPRLPPVRARIASAQVAGIDPVVGARQIGPGYLQIEDGLALGLVPGVYDLTSLVLVGGVKAGALGRARVHAVELVPTTSPTAKAVSCPHGCVRNREDR